MKYITRKPNEDDQKAARERGWDGCLFVMEVCETEEDKVEVRKWAAMTEQERQAEFERLLKF